MSRRLGRELALKALYQHDLVGGSAEELLEYLGTEERVPAVSLAFARELVRDVLDERRRLDDLIQRYSREWPLERMAAVDRNILRLGVCELLFHLETPVSVVINEAVELAKRYGELESYRFVNGILGQVARDLPQRAEEARREEGGEGPGAIPAGAAASAVDGPAQQPGGEN